MNVALTLSGHARAVNKCYYQMKKCLIDLFENIDIYIHTWDEAEFNSINIYNPVDYKIEKYNNDHIKFNILDKKVECNFINTIKMYKSLSEVSNLIKNKKYDIVIRERFDHIVEKPYDIKLIIEKINENNIIIPNQYCNAGGYNDQLAFGSYNNMIKYFKTFDILQKLIDHGAKIHPESLLKASLDFQNIKVYQYQHNFFDTFHAPLYYKYFNQ